MLRIFITSLLFAGAMVSCAPSQTQTTEQMVTVTPQLIKVSPSAARGETLTILGRYLGGPMIGKVRLGADETGTGGFIFPMSSVQSWSDTEIVLTLPPDAPIGGSWLFIEVGTMQSTGLKYSVRQ